MLQFEDLKGAMALFGLLGKKKTDSASPDADNLPKKKSGAQLAAERRALQRQQALATGYVEHPEIQKEFKRQRFMVENEGKIKAFFYLSIAGAILLILGITALIIIRNLPGRDDDHDGVPNAQDICPGFDDTQDDDHDGIPNGCEERPGSTELKVLETTLIKSGTDRYDIAVKVDNPNSEWGASPLEYSIALVDKAGKVINSSISTNDFILPGETKYLMAFNLLAVQKPAKAVLTVTYAEWIKVQNYEAPAFKTETVSYKDVKEAGISARLKGKVTNRTTFTFNNISIGILLKDKSGKVIGLNHSSVETLTPGEGRDFIVTFPQELPGVTSSGISYLTDVDVFKTDTFVQTMVVQGQRFQQFTPALPD